MHNTHKAAICDQTFQTAMDEKSMDEKFTSAEGEIQDATSLPDGRVLMVMNRRLYIWNPAKKTLRYFDDAETKGLRVDMIDQVQNKTMLCWDNHVICVGDVLLERFANLSFLEDEILAAKLLGVRVVFVTARGELRVWNGLGETPSDASILIKQVFAQQESEAELDVISANCVLCTCPHEVVLCKINEQ